MKYVMIPLLFKNVLNGLCLARSLYSIEFQERVRGALSTLRIVLILNTRVAWEFILITLKTNELSNKRNVTIITLTN